MECVVANIRDRQGTFIKLTDVSIFDMEIPHVENCIRYNPHHSISEDEWFKIENFSKTPYCLDILKQKFDSVDYRNATASDLKKLSFLISYKDNVYFFQKITPSKVLQKARFFTFGSNIEYNDQENIVLVNNSVDAIYVKSYDVLIFKYLQSITAIFKGINSLYRTATLKEVKEFVDSIPIIFCDDFCCENISIVNRKRIALALESFGKLNEEEKNIIYEYMSMYVDKVVVFDTESRKYKISTDDDLKFVIYGIEQRFYTTILKEEKRVVSAFFFV